MDSFQNYDSLGNIERLISRSLPSINFFCVNDVQFKVEKVSSRISDIYLDSRFDTHYRCRLSDLENLFRFSIKNVNRLSRGSKLSYSVDSLRMFNLSPRQSKYSKFRVLRVLYTHKEVENESTIISKNISKNSKIGVTQLNFDELQSLV